LLGIKLSVFVAGVLAFSLNSGAYVSEIISSGIESVDVGQIEAARALGVKERLIMKDIILPQAIRNILPSLINELVNMLKESAIISMLGEADLMRRAQMVAAEKFDYFTPIITAAICYYVLVFIFSSLAKV
jgi:polar amino acid transport system permease protein